MERKDTFQGIQQIRNSLSSVQSLADFFYDLSTEMLIYSETLQGELFEGGAVVRNTEVSSSEVAVLRAKASAGKKKRISFFNSQEGSILRLEVRGHEQRQQSRERYCALRGNNTGGWRGHKSTFQCSHCDFHLCVRVYPGFRKKCWDVCHSVQFLKRRECSRPAPMVLPTPTPTENLQESSDVEESAPETPSTPAARVRKRRRSDNEPSPAHSQPRSSRFRRSA